MSWTLHKFFKPFLEVTDTVSLQTEQELLAEKKCVAHLTGEVYIFLIFFYHKIALLFVNTTKINIVFYPLFLFRALLFVIYQRTRCFPEKCKRG